MATLRDYYPLITALETAFAAGKAYVAPAAPPLPAGEAYAPLQLGLADAALQGITTFTVTCLVSHAPSTLRLQGKYWETFVDGIKTGLGLENIYDYEVDILINTSDTVITNIDFNFHFLYA